MEFAERQRYAPQQPLPFAAAERYERTVLEWANAALDPAVTQCKLNVAYGSDRAQCLDVYRPAGVAHPPILVFWHGGGWTNGYKEYVRFMAANLNALGFTLVAPHYRLAPAFRLPAGYDDCLLALRAVSAHPEWGDPQRVYVSGHSAGAHLAALVGLRRDKAAAALGTALTIRGCLPVSGIMELSHAVPPPGSLEARVYEMVLSDPVDDAVMSPLCWAVGNPLPFVLTWGALDSERVLRSNRRLHALLSLQPGAVQADERAGQDHFATHLMLKDPGDPWYRALARLERADRERGA